MKVSICRKNGHEVINLNRRRAIRERCLNCSGWISKEVNDCEITDCPLYPYRTGTGKQNPKHRKKEIRGYCLSCMNGQRVEVKLCPSKDCALFAYRMGNIDRTAEIQSNAISGHIEAGSEDKSESAYLSIEEPVLKPFSVLNNQILTGAGIGSREKMVMSPWQSHRSISFQGDE